VKTNSEKEKGREKQPATTLKRVAKKGRDNLSVSYVGKGRDGKKKGGKKV